MQYVEPLEELNEYIKRLHKKIDNLTHENKALREAVVYKDNRIRTLKEDYKEISQELFNLQEENEELNDVIMTLRKIIDEEDDFIFENKGYC